ncbi:HAD family hydrolase [Ligilactobacillus salivarius]|uniref:HAD family hydrolase n=1 Tax=Ligilactobacillus salivarius TaxID=1624 RepID=UPI0009DAC249|nr:HAD family hydrolase [Ligilactobacillus salivarius]MDL1931213.1 HAD family hydrolase [Ligilactobacillus salivarius]MYU79744.1 HAD family hydrolase [Ligilactobacillus salivarius]MYV07773.1 HAD family hydrolase [Ligilactobacillus salivarius]MYV14364.1 HAD family hydrolase [Ligilactobacillus salivarius]MYV23587.1 HAD family hydrolase [Ligilactobacillus salivarius]
MLENYLFDFDGTIADSGETGIIAVQKAFVDYGLKKPTAESVRYYMGVPIETFFPKISNRELNDAEWEEVFAIFRQYYSELELEITQLFPGMKETLMKLVEDGKRLFVVSSKNSVSLNRNLENLGIADLFTDTIGSDQVENYKPAPDGINILANRHDLDKVKTVMIGDAKYDLQMGKAAEVKTCGCAWDTYDIELLKNEEPDYLLEKVEKLLEI